MRGEREWIGNKDEKCEGMDWDHSMAGIKGARECPMPMGCQGARERPTSTGWLLAQGLQLVLNQNLPPSTGLALDTRVKSEPKPDSDFRRCFLCRFQQAQSHLHQKNPKHQPELCSLSQTPKAGSAQHGGHTEAVGSPQGGWPSREEREKQRGRVSVPACTAHKH